jgi:hypothetical protein
MKKRFLNVIFLGALLVGTVGTVTSCKDYDDDIKNLQDDVAALQQTVGDLQKAISAGSVITGVTATDNGIVVSLSDGKTYTISNGKNGADGTNGTDGANGKDGSVVTIGSNGNWFIDGVDTGKAAKGDKGDQGAPGNDGKDGTDGKDGADATIIYYYPATSDEADVAGDETGYWVKVTIDGETTTKEMTNDKWLVAAKGAITAVWDTKAGTLTLMGVEGAEDGIVAISLWSGLSSLAFVPDYVSSPNMAGAILFNQFAFQDVNKNNATFVVENNPIASYRLNPKNAKIDDYTFSFIGRSVQTRTNADIDNLLTSDNFTKNAETGFLDFHVTLNQSVYDANFKDKNGNVITSKVPVVALKATKKDASAEYVSDYATISYNVYDWFGMYRKAPFEKDGTLNTAGLYDYTNKPLYSDYTDIQLEITEGSSLDLNTIPVYLTEGWDNTVQSWKYYSVQSLGVDVKYEFTKDLNDNGKDDDKVAGADGTDQQQYVKLDANGIVTIDRAVATGTGAAAIGKAPVFLMKALVNGKVVAKQYILINIVEKETQPSENVTITVAAKSLNYTELNGTSSDAKSTIGITAQQFNDILGKVGMDNNTFWNNYVNLSAVYSDAAMTKPVAGVHAEVNTGLSVVQLTFNDQVLAATNAKAYVKLTTNDPRYGAVIFEFTYSVVYPTLPNLKPENILPGTTNTIVVQGSMVNGIWDYSARLQGAFAFENYTVPNNVNSVIYRVTDKKTGWSLSGIDYTDQVLGVTNLTEDTTYDLQLVATLANGNEIVYSFKVMFRIPFTASLGDIELNSAVMNDAASLASKVQIKDRSGVLVYGVIDSNGTVGLTEKGKAYGLTAASLDFVYDVETYKNVVCDATTGMVTWTNDVAIFSDVKLKSTVTITFAAPILTLTANGQVTILGSK